MALRHHIMGYASKTAAAEALTARGMPREEIAARLEITQKRVAELLSGARRRSRFGAVLDLPADVSRALGGIAPASPPAPVAIIDDFDERVADLFDRRHSMSQIAAILRAPYAKVIAALARLAGDAT